MNIADESRAKYFEMLTAFKATLTNAEDEIVFEEAIPCDFSQVQYKEWLLQTNLSASSQNMRLQTLNKLVTKLIKYVDSNTL